MEIINVNTVKADSFEDLSSILTANSEVIYVYLGVDIDMTSGIRLHNSRSSIVIDGEYPQGSGNIHTLRDTGGDLGMIYKSNISNLDITFKNMTITGRNYYGMPRIADGNTNVTVTYQNVTYTGPQITWHWSGKTRYIDCDIRIMYANFSPMEEMAQICQAEIGGKTTIYHNSTGFPTFSFYKSNASLTILEDADVTITSNYDFFIHELSPKFVIQPRASLTLTTQRGISRNASFRISSFLIDENSSFRYIQNSNSEGNAALYINNSLIVNKGARVYMQADFASSSTSKRLLQFTAISASREMKLNDPKSFVLYNRGTGTAVYFGAMTEFSFKGGQVNFWRDAKLFPAAGTFDDSPLYRWHNPEWSTFEINGSAATDSTTVSSSTLTPPISPDLSYLKLHEARVLSVGDLPLTVNPVVNDRTPVNGTTDPYANIKVLYTDETGTHTPGGTADGSGYFSIPTPSQIPVDTMVDVSANVPFLYITKTAKTQEAGELYIESAPERIKYVVPSLSSSPLVILGRESDEGVVVIDKRIYNTTKWNLMVTISGPMFCEKSGHTLPGKVAYVPPPGSFSDMEDLEPGIAKKVYTGGPYVERTPVVWTGNTGLLLHLTGPLHLGDDYIASLEWTVTPVTP